MFAASLHYVLSTGPGERLPPPSASLPPSVRPSAASDGRERPSGGELERNGGLAPRLAAAMSTGSSDPSSRKEFDVKQILRIRWRWFGHPAVPPPPRDDLAGRRTGTGGRSSSAGPPPPPSPPPPPPPPPRPPPSNFSGRSSTPDGIARGHGGLVTSGSAGSNLCNGTKFAASSGGSSRSRSESQPERSGSLAAWPSPPPPPRRRSRPVSNTEPSARGGAGGEDSDPPDTDSSSCRTSNSSATLSSCASMEPCVCPEDGAFTAPSHADVTFRKMEGYLRSRQLCDVTLVAGDRRIPAHRLVLSSVSDYFAAMFTSDVREAKQDEVKMEGVDPDALWVLVQYAYTGRLELREDTIESLLSASCLLQLSSAVQACCSFLMKQLHPSNCIGISSYANAQGCHDLRRVAHTYTMEHFAEVVGAQEFTLLPVDEMERLLTSDDINVPDEETVVTALLTWVHHDAAARQRDLPQLLAHVRLPLLQPQFLADLEASPALRDSADCQRLLLEGMKYHLLPQRRPLLQSPRTRPRKATVGAMFAVGGMDATKGATSIEQYCLRRDTWKQVAAMSGRRLQFGVAVLKGRLYVVGGRDGLKTLNTVECYNPRCKSWSVMPPISTHRHGLGGILKLASGASLPAWPLPEAPREWQYSIASCTQSEVATVPPACAPWSVLTRTPTGGPLVLPWRNGAAAWAWPRGTASCTPSAVTMRPPRLWRRG
ncbi:kelch-like protein 5 isoform X2 [Phyllopteryx taeniolatus]|uniref:kelch-like protein 5 isoform X2 n=1 Tax=Phyllopteryx taeniolatus TaxID=161469 RepID=UPI002AD52186|nr:kelch-like protein 5 isoform X2 [Phyllopteryx taeniolatus]